MKQYQAYEKQVSIERREEYWLKTGDVIFAPTPACAIESYTRGRYSSPNPVHVLINELDGEVQREYVLSWPPGVRIERVGTS